MQRSLLVAGLLGALMFTGGSLPGTCFEQKASVPRRPDTVAIASEKIIELLALMDTDKNGKVSKQEWMKFMETAFDRLDKDKKGELDPKELLQSTGTGGHVRASDLGK